MTIAFCIENHFSLSGLFLKSKLIYFKIGIGLKRLT